VSYQGERSSLPHTSLSAPLLKLSSFCYPYGHFLSSSSSHTLNVCLHPAFYIFSPKLPPASHCTSLSHASHAVSPRRKNCRFGFHGLVVLVCDGAKRCPGHEDQADSRCMAVRFHVVLPQDQKLGASALRTPLLASSFQSIPYPNMLFNLSLATRHVHGVFFALGPTQVRDKTGLCWDETPNHVSLDMHFISSPRL
jgi:hypothetical protein